MLVLQRFTTPDDVCAYLPDRNARLRYEFAARLSPAEYEVRMDQGWRKFGGLMFRPVCRTCNECRPIRIDAEAFTPDRSQTRALRRNADLIVRTGPPTVNDIRLNLYRRYHEAQTSRKGWPDSEKSADDYAFAFVHNPLPGAVEITAWEALPDGSESLRLVVLTESTPNVVSGIYHYHDPDLAVRSLGTFGMLHTIHLAQTLGKRWAYFGFYVADCPSLAYKARFRPCEVLGEDGVWQRKEKI